MRRIKEDFVNILAGALLGRLKKMTALEIGCGDGMRSVDIAERCHKLIGIDPDPLNVKIANRRHILNAAFSQGRAEVLEYPSATFDIVIFTLSNSDLRTISPTLLRGRDSNPLRKLMGLPGKPFPTLPR
jgi:ubiquinone/menaquinone biosynthesis C-methylase UbiE